MAKSDVSVFKPYDFIVGQKIFIHGGPRQGDWEVMGVTDRKVKLRCPFTQKEVEWDRFCYLLEERTGTEWPRKD